MSLYKNCGPQQCACIEDSAINPLVYYPVAWATGGPKQTPVRLDRATYGSLVGFKSFKHDQGALVVGFSGDGATEDLYQGGQNTGISDYPTAGGYLGDVWYTEGCTLCCVPGPICVRYSSGANIEFVTTEQLGTDAANTPGVSGIGIVQDVSCCCCSLPYGSFNVATAGVSISAECGEKVPAYKVEPPPSQTGVFVKIPIYMPLTDGPDKAVEKMFKLDRGYCGAVRAIRMFNCPGEVVVTSLRPAGKSLDRVAKMEKKYKEKLQDLVENSGAADPVKTVLNNQLEGVDAATWHSDRCECWYPFEAGCINDRNGPTIKALLGPNGLIAFNDAGKQTADTKAMILRGELLVELSETCCSVTSEATITRT